MSAEQIPKSSSQNDMARAKKMALLFVLVPILITVVWGLTVKLTSVPQREESPQPVVAGAPAPIFSFPLLSGGTSSLGDYKGKVVLVNVWATWCPPCIEEMPDLQNLYAQMKSQNLPFEILGVSIDALGGDAVQKWVERFRLTFPILLDPRGSIKKLYRTTGVPETFIIDPQGRLVQKIIGPRKWDSLQMVNFLKQVYQERRPGNAGS